MNKDIYYIEIDHNYLNEKLENLRNIKFLQANQNKNRYFNIEFINHDARVNAISKIILKSQPSLKNSTISISIAILDVCISLCNLPESSLLDIAQVSLKLAININNDDNSYLQNINKSQIFTQYQRFCLEANLLNCLQHPLYLITPFHFFEMLLNLEGVAMDLPSNPFINIFGFKDFTELVVGLNSMLFRYYECNMFTSVSIAVGVISMARFICDAEDLLPSIVSEITEVSFEDTYPIRELISNHINSIVSVE
jgi:hypothetical protein